MKISRMRARQGFTLIELLVVIAIIATLVALTVGGVLRWLNKPADATAAKELISLGEACEKFYKDFGMYPPSKIWLKPNASDYDVVKDPLQRQSLEILTKMFGTRMAFTNIDWTGGSGLPKGGELLEGDQCMVFFLNGPGYQGFAKVAGPPGNVNPAASKAAVPDRYGPYYFFPQNRLFFRSGKTYFKSFMDPYSSPGGTAGPDVVPYAFFSTGMTRKYDPTHAHLGVAPYLSAVAPAKKYWRPDSFQIICAGKDHQFGPGGFWTAANASGIPQAGQDDQSNFHDAFLGVSGN